MLYQIELRPSAPVAQVVGDFGVLSIGTTPRLGKGAHVERPDSILFLARCVFGLHT